MSLALLTLGLLCAPPASAQGGYPGGGSGGYPGGGSGGYPGGGSGGGHYWQISYAQNGNWSEDIRDVPSPGQTTPEGGSLPAHPTGAGSGGGGGGDKINGTVTDTVTATLTWVPAADKNNTSDPPPSKVHIKEYGYAWEDSLWGGIGPVPTGAGTADDGLGDPQVPDGNGYRSMGDHSLVKDGSSGSITLDPVTMSATNPTSTWQSYPDYPSYHYWDWTGGEYSVSFSVEVVPPAHPINFRLRTRSDGTPDVDILDGGELIFHYVWASSSGSLADLDDNKCVVYEHVTYAGGSTGQVLPDPFTGVLYYYPPDPFVGRIREPTQLGVPGSDGACADDQRYGTGDKSNDFSTPYKTASFSSTQNFFYHSDDLASREFPVLLGPLTITRRVYQGANPNDWFYDVSKSGYSSTLSLSF